MFKGSNKDTKTTLKTLFWCLYFKLLTEFRHCFNISVIDFEQVDISWEMINYECLTKNVLLKEVIDTLMLMVTYFKRRLLSYSNFIKLYQNVGMELVIGALDP